jgi:hypothetical protein
MEQLGKGIRHLLQRLANPSSERCPDRDDPLVVGEKSAHADRRQSVIEYFTCSAHLSTRGISSRQRKLRWIHSGKFIGVTKSFAGGSPSEVGDDGSAHILVRTRQHTEMYVRTSKSALEK